MSRLLYNGIIHAIPVHWKILLNSEHAESLIVNSKINYNDLCDKTKVSSFVYNFYCDKHAMSIYKYCNFWEHKLNCMIEYADFCQLFTNIKNISSTSKHQAFQYRLLLNKIFTNNILFHWGKVDSKKCEWCDTCDSQDVVHLLVECGNSAGI